MTRFPISKARGFSLVEMVVAIVIMSILSIGLVEFITNSADGYVRSATRNQLSSSGRFVIERISMEMHNALPESVRTPPTGPAGNGDQCIEFIPVRAASTYIDPAFRPAGHKTTFNAINFAAAPADLMNVFAVIYPVQSSDLYGAAGLPPAVPPMNTTEAIAQVSSVLDADPMDGLNELTTVTNHRFKRRSSADRIFLTDQPVSFCVAGNKLYRYENYGFHATQCTPSTCLPSTTATGRVLISDQLDNSALTGGGNGQAFDLLQANRRRNAVIQLDLNFSQDGEQIRLNHEILQQSTP